MKREGVTLADLAGAARQKGFRVAAAQADGWFLKRHRIPGIAWVEGDHYVVFLAGKQPHQVRVFDPSQPGEETMSADELARRASGIVLLVARGKQSLPELRAQAGSPAPSP